MTLTEFSAQVGEWARDVSNTAIELYKDGCAESDCVSLAITITNSKRAKSAAVRARLGPAIPVDYRPRGSN